MNKLNVRDGLSPKATVFLLGFGTAVSLLGESTLYTILPLSHFSSQLGITMTMVGVLLGTNRATRLFTNGPIGLIYERFPRRPLLTASLCLGAFASLIYTIGFGFWPLFFGRILWGIAWSLLWIGSKTVILEISDENNRGTLSGIYQMCFQAGAGLSALFGGVIADRMGFQFGQRLSAAIILLAALAWFLFLPETRSGNKPLKLKNRIRQQEILKWDTIIPAAITIFLIRFIERGVLAGTASNWINDLVNSQAKFSLSLMPAATLAGLFSAIKILPGMGSAPIFGYISDRLNRRWFVITIALIFCGVGLWMMSTEWFLIALGGVFVTSLFGSSTETLIPAIIGDRVRRGSSARTLGIIYTAADLGSTIGPILTLAVLDSTSLSINTLYVGCIGLIILAIITTLFSGRKESITMTQLKRIKNPIGK